MCSPLHADLISGRRTFVPFRKPASRQLERIVPHRSFLRIALSHLACLKFPVVSPPPELFRGYLSDGGKHSLQNGADVWCAPVLFLVKTPNPFHVRAPV